MNVGLTRIFKGSPARIHVLACRLSSMELMNEYFNKRTDNLSRTQTKKDQWWSTLETHYKEEQRHYHTMKHIEDMQALWKENRPHLKQPKLVALAILFHDVIYQPQKSDNEEQSDILFQRFADDMEMPEAEKATVSEWIIATKSHKTTAHVSNTPGTEDLHYFLDFDMAVLGRDAEDYKNYARQIRSEYCHIPEETYMTGRAKVLRSFLEIPYIYATERYRSQNEKRARENITNEIKTLEKGQLL